MLLLRFQMSIVFGTDDFWNWNEDRVIGYFRDYARVDSKCLKAIETQKLIGHKLFVTFADGQLIKDYVKAYELEYNNIENISDAIRNIADRNGLPFYEQATNYQQKREMKAAIERKIGQNAAAAAAAAAVFIPAAVAAVVPPAAVSPSIIPPAVSLTQPVLTTGADSSAVQTNLSPAVSLSTAADSSVATLPSSAASVFTNSSAASAVMTNTTVCRPPAIQPTATSLPPSYPKPKPITNKLTAADLAYASGCDVLNPITNQAYKPFPHRFGPVFDDEGNLILAVAPAVSTSPVVGLNKNGNKIHLKNANGLSVTPVLVIERRNKALLSVADAYGRRTFGAAADGLPITVSADGTLYYYRNTNIRFDRPPQSTAVNSAVAAKPLITNPFKPASSSAAQTVYRLTTDAGPADTKVPPTTKPVASTATLKPVHAASSSTMPLSKQHQKTIDGWLHHLGQNERSCINYKSSITEDCEKTFAGTSDLPIEKVWIRADAVDNIYSTCWQALAINNERRKFELSKSDAERKAGPSFNQTMAALLPTNAWQITNLISLGRLLAVCPRIRFATEDRLVSRSTLLKTSAALLQNIGAFKSFWSMNVIPPFSVGPAVNTKADTNAAVMMIDDIDSGPVNSAAAASTPVRKQSAGISAAAISLAERSTRQTDRQRYIMDMLASTLLTRDERDREVGPILAAELAKATEPASSSAAAASSSSSAAAVDTNRLSANRLRSIYELPSSAKEPLREYAKKVLLAPLICENQDQLSTMQHLPTKQSLADMAGRYGFDMSAADLRSFVRLVTEYPAIQFIDVRTFRWTFWNKACLDIRRILNGKSMDVRRRYGFDPDRKSKVNDDDDDDKQSESDDESDEDAENDSEDESEIDYNDETETDESDSETMEDDEVADDEPTKTTKTVRRLPPTTVTDKDRQVVIDLLSSTPLSERDRNKKIPKEVRRELRKPIPTDLAGLESMIKQVFRMRSKIRSARMLNYAVTVRLARLLVAHKKIWKPTVRYGSRGKLAGDWYSHCRKADLCRTIKPSYALGLLLQDFPRLEFIDVRKAKSKNIQWRRWQHQTALVRQLAPDQPKYDVWRSVDNKSDSVRSTTSSKRKAGAESAVAAAASASVPAELKRQSADDSKSENRDPKRLKTVSSTPPSKTSTSSAAAAASSKPTAANGLPPAFKTVDELLRYLQSLNLSSKIIDWSVEDVLRYLSRWKPSSATVNLFRNKDHAGNELEFIINTEQNIREIFGESDVAILTDAWKSLNLLPKTE